MYITGSESGLEKDTGWKLRASLMKDCLLYTSLPGFTFGQVYTRTGTFACGSEGMTLKFHGKTTHAAYPENGLSPAHAVGELLRQVPEFLTPEH